MLQAFKSKDGKLVPFTSVVQAYKGGSYYMQLLLMGRERADSFCFNSVEDRDQQFTNFEKWLTTKTNSI